MAKKELKNCPCCNCEAELQMDDLGREYVECIACLLRTDAYRNDGYAAEIWNTRHDDWVSVKEPPKSVNKVYLVSDGEAWWAEEWIECNDGTWKWENLMVLKKPIIKWKPITLQEGE